MDRVKSVLNSIKLVVVSTLETIFAIGTSIVAAGVLIFVSSGVSPDDLID
ncbi:MAG: hypothetical protein GXX85_02635 [Ignavibacteria bacterium]|nr:hypothetical protein [Ignavibacteria bacterium]